MSQQLVQKLWNYGIFLRDDGLSYDDDVEQLTFLLFLKMADEQTKPNLDSRESMKREWKGIEPSRRLFSRHNGFEARDGHQIRVHSRSWRRAS